MAPPTKIAAKKKCIDIWFDLDRKELVIDFDTIDQARAYQMKNPESRIFAEENQCSVWLPISPSMKHIRGYGDGLAISFSSVEIAKIWCSRSILGRPRSSNSKEVYILGSWVEHELAERLRSERGTKEGRSTKSEAVPSSHPNSSKLGVDLGTNSGSPSPAVAQ